MCKQYTIMITFFLTVAVVYCERPTGFYVDNGFDQTIILQTFTHKEKRKVEKELLNLLGLQSRPKRMARSSLLVKRSAPSFLLNIYKNVLSYSDNGLVKKQYDGIAEFNLNRQDVHIIDQSDLIMTFGAHNPHSTDGSKRNRGRRIWFDVSEIPAGEHLISAELRLYHSAKPKELESNGSYRISVYRVARTKSGGRVKYYIDSVNVTIGQHGWITLNISTALKHWMNYPEENRGLFLAVYHTNYTHAMRPDDIGIVGVTGTLDKQPFMVGFFNETGIRKKVLRQKRSTGAGQSIINVTNERNHPYVHRAFQRKGKSCNIESLYVSFKDLEWQDWIIAPEGYDAYYCSGECNFPLNTHMNATNHAIVQMLVHLITPEKVPKPRCAPTKLSSISVLYFLDDSNVVLKKYKNMVVNSCGCH